MSTQNRTIITTTEPVTPLLLLSAMGREINGICLEWISAPVNKHGETYDWKCGITADGRTHSVEGPSGPMAIISKALMHVEAARSQAGPPRPAPKAEAAAEKGRGDTSKPRPRRILIVGPESMRITREDQNSFDLIASTGGDDFLRVFINNAKPSDVYRPFTVPLSTVFQDYGIHTTKLQTEVAP